MSNLSLYIYVTATTTSKHIYLNGCNVSQVFKNAIIKLCCIVSCYLDHSDDKNMISMTLHPLTIYSHQCCQKGDMLLHKNMSVPGPGTYHGSTFMSYYVGLRGASYISVGWYAYRARRWIHSKTMSTYENKPCIYVLCISVENLKSASC